MSTDILSRLESELIRFACACLNKAECFKPFGVVEESDSGQIGMATADGNDMRAVISTLADGMKAQALKGGIAAGGVCWLNQYTDQQTGKTVPTIICHVETVSGRGKMVMRPYKKRWLRGVTVGESVMNKEGELLIFNRR